MADSLEQVSIFSWVDSDQELSLTTLTFYGTVSIMPRQHPTLLSANKYPKLESLITAKLKINAILSVILTAPLNKALLSSYEGAEVILALSLVSNINAIVVACLELRLANLLATFKAFWVTQTAA